RTTPRHGQGFPLATAPSPGSLGRRPRTGVSLSYRNGESRMDAHRHWRWIRALALGFGLVLGIGAPAPRPAISQEIPRRSIANQVVEQSLQTTLATGRPTILAITTETAPATRRLWRQVTQAPAVADWSRSAQFVEVTAEAAPDLVRKLR